MNKKNVRSFNPGDKVLILGETDFNREIVDFVDPISFVQHIAQKHKNSFETNQDFMHSMSEVMSELNYTIPHHSEEAFISGLIRIGVCKRANLN